MKLHFLLLTFFIFPSSPQQQAIMGDSSSSSDSDSESESDPNTPITAPATTNDATAATSEAPPTAGGDQEGNQQNKAPRRTHSIAHYDFLGLSGYAKDNCGRETHVHRPSYQLERQEASRFPSQPPGETNQGLLREAPCQEEAEEAEN
jgi:hypothetical protein